MKAIKKKYSHFCVHKDSQYNWFQMHSFVQRKRSISMGGKYEDTMAHQFENGKEPLKDAQ